MKQRNGLWWPLVAKPFIIYHPSGGASYYWGYYARADTGRDLPTAIVWTYIPSLGFVLGADGKREGLRPGEPPLSVKAQKIFFAEDAQLAYAWSGTTALFGDDNSEFSFAKVSEQALKQRRPKSFITLVEAFIKHIHKGLVAADARGYPPASKEDPNLIAKVVLLGYFSGQPRVATAEFRHDGNYVPLLPAPTYFSGEVPTAFDLFSGPRDSLQYVGDLRRPESLEDAANLIKSYIEFCSKHPEIEGCDKIGGHVHIAFAEPSGVRWHIPPLPVSHTTSSRPEK